MGDVLTLIEKAEATFDAGRGGEGRGEAAQGPVHARGLPRPDAPGARRWARSRTSSGCCPGMPKELRNAEIDERRARPGRGDHLLDDARRSAATRRSSTARAGCASRRAAAPPPHDVNALLKQFKQVQQMMQRRPGRARRASAGCGEPARRARRPRAASPAAGRARSAGPPARARLARRRRSLRAPTRGTSAVAVKIRLMRVGKKKQPTYRVVVADARVAPRRALHRDHRPVRPAPGAVASSRSTTTRALDWLRKGAQPTEQVQKLLTVAGRVGDVRVRAAEPDVTKLNRRGYATGKVARRRARRRPSPRPPRRPRPRRRPPRRRGRGRGAGAAEAERRGSRRGAPSRGRAGSRVSDERRRRRGHRRRLRGRGRGAGQPHRRRATSTTTRSAPRATASSAPARRPSSSTSPARSPTTPTRSRSTSEERRDEVVAARARQARATWAASSAGAAA